jgi:hypothetical protein
MSSRLRNNLTNPQHRHYGDDGTLFLDKFGSLTFAFSSRLVNGKNLYTDQKSGRFHGHHDDSFSSSGQTTAQRLTTFPIAPQPKPAVSYLEAY